MDTARHLFTISIFVLSFGAIATLCYILVSDAYYNTRGRKAKQLKNILDLQRENTLLRRAIKDAIVMLCRRKPHLVVEYEDHDADWMLSQLTHVLKCELAEHPNSDPNKPQDSAE